MYKEATIVVDKVVELVEETATEVGVSGMFMFELEGLKDEVTGEWIEDGKVTDEVVKEAEEGTAGAASAHVTVVLTTTPLQLLCWP